MPFRCLCGQILPSSSVLSAHKTRYGHNVQCACTRVFKDESCLVDHQRATNCQSVPAGPRDSSPTPKCNSVAPDPNKPKSSSEHCPVCHKRCANEDGIQAHMDLKHQACPECHQILGTHKQREEHQKSSGHCWCQEHQICFGSVAGFRQHNKLPGHVSVFGCLECQKDFATPRALEDHLSSLGHENKVAALRRAREEAEAAARREIGSFRCEECKRNFKTPSAYQQHKKSVKHQPLSELVCPLCKNESKHFTSPSALLMHLESGKCESGMTRLELNALAHEHDKDRHITLEKNAAAATSSGSVAEQLTGCLGSSSLTETATSILGDDDDGVSLWDSDPKTDHDHATCSSISTFEDAVEDIFGTGSASGVSVLPSVASVHARSRNPSSAGGGVILTPASSSRAMNEWPFTNTHNTVPLNTSFDAASLYIATLGPTRKAWPCMVSDCGKVFKKEQGLLDHLDSPFHALKLFHCPNSLLISGRKRHENVFKTLSGFAQHIEAEACVGGKATLQMLVGLVESRIQQATGCRMKLLKAAR